MWAHCIRERASGGKTPPRPDRRAMQLAWEHETAAATVALERNLIRNTKELVLSVRICIACIEVATW